MNGREGLNPAGRWAVVALLVLVVNLASAPLGYMPAQSAEIALSATVVAATDDSAPLLVKFKPNTARDEMDRATKAAGGTLVREHPQLRLRVIKAPPNDSLYAHQWALPKISWDHAYGVVPIPGSAKIAILDTGIDATHPDLSDRTTPGQSFVGGSPTTTTVAGVPLP
jgi:hypothetical protein